MKLTKIAPKLSSLVLLISLALIPLGASTVSAMSASSTTGSSTSSTGTTATPTTTSTNTNATPTTTNGYTVYTVTKKTNKTLLDIYYAVVVVIGLLVLVSIWKVFNKAGEPGWAAIIPVYNLWVMFKIGGKPGWWSILMLIPIVNIVAFIMYIIALLEVAKRFGKGPAFAVFGLIIFSFVGWPILGFGDSTYSVTNAA